jgi:cytoplasmic tRNA 2-thiolation protein 2
MNYVATKVAKRMDGFKVRRTSTDPPRRVLLPISFGASSITLTHVLDQQIRNQLERTSRTGYELHVIYVDQSGTGEEEIPPKLMELLKQRYPMHSYSIVVLEKALRYTDVSAYSNIAVAGITQDGGNGRPSTSLLEQMNALLSSLPSATSRADMIAILRTQLIVASAKSKGCECIVWGDSTTRLAERTLAETSKGRGFSLPWQTGDGLSPHGLNFVFPMRDLLRKEITTYTTLTSPPLNAMVVEKSPIPQASASSRNTTIDDLMSQYFESVEESYPSIVSNVVRTSNRLKAPEPTKNTPQCRICRLPVVVGTQGIHGWGGDQEEEPDSKIMEGSTEDKANVDVLCYGCARSVDDPLRT